MKKNEVKNVGQVLESMSKKAVNPVMVAVSPIVNAKEKEKAEEAKIEIEEDKQPTKEQTAEELQAEMERKTAELQKCLEVLERKKKLSNDRTAFMSALDDLDEAENKIGEEDGFNTPNYKLRFTGSYGSSEIFSLSNRFILLEFIDFMRGRIKSKISEIELQLIA